MHKKILYFSVAVIFPLVLLYSGISPTYEAFAKDIENAVARSGNQVVAQLAAPAVNPSGSTTPQETPQPSQVQIQQPQPPAPQQVAPSMQSQPAAPLPAPMPFAPASPPAARRGEVSFNFDDADIFSVIQTIFGDVMKVNYIIDPSVKGKVNYRSVAPIAKDDVLPLMEVILRISGIGIVEEGGLYRIVPIADISREPAPVGVGRDASKVVISGKALVQVVPVQYVQSSEMVRVLTPFLSKTAVIIDVPKSNYIIISDTDSNVRRLLQLVSIFDSEKLRQVTPQVHVHPVQNGKAKDIAALLQQVFLGSKSSLPKTSAQPQSKPPVAGQPPQAAQPPASQPQISMGQATGEALVSETTRIIPDDVTNTLVILATPEDYLLISETIKKIDIVPRQVMIEALIAEVSLTDTMSFGLEWNLSTDVNITKVKPFVNPVNLAGTAATSFGVDTTTGGGGFTFTGTDPTGNVRAKLQALATDNKVKVLSSPHILVSDNREATIQVGDQVPIATSQTTSTGTIPAQTTTTIQYKDTGTILKIKPQVNDSGLVALEISQEVSDFSTKSLFGSDQIIINKRAATTYLVAQDGQTIVIGGLIKDKTTKDRNGLPLLSRIPLLGYLFGRTTDSTDRTELVILLTPRVVRNQGEAKNLTNEYVEKYRGLSKSGLDLPKLMLPRSGDDRKASEGGDAGKSLEQGIP